MAGRRFQIGNVSLYIVKKDYSCLCMWMTKNWLERNKILIRCGKYLTNKLIWENQDHSLIMLTWDVLKENVKQAKILWTIPEPCSNPKFPQEQQKKLPSSEKKLNMPTWSYDMEGHAKKCVERCCALANKTTQQLHKVSTPCLHDHHLKEEELKSVGEFSSVCSQFVLKCLYLERIGLDMQWSVNKLARVITKWARACDKRLASLISYIHFYACIQTVLLCRKYGTTMQIGTVSRL